MGIENLDSMRAEMYEHALYVLVICDERSIISSPKVLIEIEAVCLTNCRHSQRKREKHSRMDEKTPV